MKIAVYYNLPFGGAKRSVQEHVRGLRQHGHTVDVYTLDKEQDMFDPGKYANSEHRYSFESKTLDFPILFRVTKDLYTFLKLPNLHKQIAKEIDSKLYDVVLIHQDIATNTPYLPRFLKTKNVFYCMEPLRMVYEYGLRITDNLNIFNRFYENINRYIRKNIDRTNALAADKTIAFSHFCREYMIHAYNLFPQIIGLGVDIEIFKPISVKKKNQVLFLAEKETIYGYDFAVEAINLIPEPKRPELKIVYGTRGKKYRITDVELVKIYNESIASLALSKFEAFGLVPLESMACRVPVIAFNVAGHRETVRNNETGFLVDFDAQQIADKIQYLIENPLIAKQMGVAGRKSMEKSWTWKRQIQILNTFLENYAKDNSK